MDLKDFIKETLIQITSGIQESQMEVRKSGGFVNPAHRINSKQTDSSHFGAIGTGQNIFMVDFDVSISVKEDTGGDAKAQLKVASIFSAEAGGSKGITNTAINRISFKVPLALPIDSETEKTLKDKDAIEKSRREKETQEARNSAVDYNI